MLGKKLDYVYVLNALLIIEFQPCYSERIVFTFDRSQWILSKAPNVKSSSSAAFALVFLSLDPNPFNGR